MSNAKNHLLINYISFLCLIICCQFTYSSVTPREFVISLSDRLLKELDLQEEQLKSNSKLAYAIARRVVMPEIDVKGMSRSVLGRKVWNKMSANQKTEFTETFTDLVIKTYSKSLKNYDDDKLKVLPMNKRYIGKKRVVIKSLLLRDNGQKIKLKYRMIAKKNSWKIYDLSVAGVSLLQNFRTQFSRELKRGSVDDLIQKIKKN